MQKLQLGMNLNVHPLATVGRPSNAADLGGLSWVRMVFFFHAAVRPDNHNIHLFEQNLDSAFAYYDPLIDGYSRLGIRTLLVLNQETFAGNAPWFPGSDGNWDKFAVDFAAFCGKIAAHYRGKNVAYEIWNEGDIVGESSVFVPADKFARVLKHTSLAIRNADPGAQIIFGGLAAGTGASIAYVKLVRQALGGPLPVNAVAVHPYGHFVGATRPALPTGWFGSLDDALKQYTAQFDSLPVWITEIGVSEPGQIRREHWPEVVRYMETVIDLVNTRYAQTAPVLMWFAWSDIMRDAGIVDSNGNPKQPIYARFFELARSLAAPKQLITLEATQLLTIHQPDGTHFSQIGRVKAGERMQVLENPVLARAKIGQSGQWIRLRLPDGSEGWSAAWFLKTTSDTQSALQLGGVPNPFFVAPTLLLNTRSGSLGQLPVLTQVPAGQTVEVVENPEIALAKIEFNGTNTGDRTTQWILVRTQDGVEGWASAALLKQRQPEQPVETERQEETPVAPPTPQDTPAGPTLIPVTPTVPEPIRAEATAPQLNVRSGPGTQHRIIATVNQGRVFAVLENQGEWLKVRYGAGEAYIASQFVTLNTPNFLNGFLIEQRELLEIALPPNRIIPPQAGTEDTPVDDVWNRYGGLLEVLAVRLDIPLNALVAVIAAESGGNAFGPDGRMIIRFENHIFYDQWGKDHRDTFSMFFRFDESPRSSGHQWRPNVNAPWISFHGRQALEWQVFDFARMLNETAALHSTSFGAPQIIGFNFASIGYESALQMFRFFAGSAQAQFLGMFDFVRRSASAVQALRNRDYVTFASFYNGAGNAQNYGAIIGRYADQFDRFIATAVPRVNP